MNQSRIENGAISYDFESAQGLIDNALEKEAGIVESWAYQIREAAKRGESVPIKPLARHEHLLDRACRMAGVLVVGGAV